MLVNGTDELSDLTTRVASLGITPKSSLHTTTAELTPPPSPDLNHTATPVAVSSPPHLPNHDYGTVAVSLNWKIKIDRYNAYHHEFAAELRAVIGKRVRAPIVPRLLPIVALEAHRPGFSAVVFELQQELRAGRTGSAGTCA